MHGHRCVQVVGEQIQFHRPVSKTTPTTLDTTMRQVAPAIGFAYHVRKSQNVMNHYGPRSAERRLCLWEQP